ncbi:MAG TPA: hypothetical protein VK504_09970 [Vicinamibacterales bacterium]|jgi:hypothetical protein|nr:hypothetical protein [Vicinamibacterales bacterium]
MTLSRRRSVIATVGLIATSWLFAACSTASPPETQPLGTAGVEPLAIAVETSNQSVIVTNNAGKPIEDVLITIQPVSVAPPFTLTVRRMENGEKRDIALGQFRSNDGTTFSPRLYKARQVTVTATDIVGKKHEITKPWRP